jgi:hypothetical protein
MLLRVTAMLQASSTRETRDAAREVKFLVTPDLAAEILTWARARLAADPYASGGESGDQYLTTSLYFDTTDFAVYHRRGSYRRSKLRIRRYGSADVAFLERKLRTARLLSKRRTTIPIEELAWLGARSTPHAWAGRWFEERLEARRLTPVMQVSYRRSARVGQGVFGPMRLTFDEQIIAQPCDRFEFLPISGVPVVPANVIIEMKYCVEAPAVLRNLVEEFKLEPAGISKYRFSLDALAAASSIALPKRSGEAAQSEAVRVESSRRDA